MTENWFSTPIYYNHIKNINEVTNELHEVYNTLNENKLWQEVNTWNSHLISTPNFEENLLNTFNLEFFRREIDNHVKNYLQNIGNIEELKYKIEDCWMSLSRPNDFFTVHHHGESDISGVYYFKTNQNDGDLFFESPNQLTSITKCFKHLPSRVFYKPEIGKIILFPGWLRHGVMKNTTTDNRISISFNIVIDK
jgi:uncharacterized protein (TIGR02466 family)